jgi:hypothetical protein
MTNESIIESAPRSGPGRRRVVLVVAVGLVVAAVVGVGLWRSRDAGAPHAAASPAARASELYAADGTTLIARFDTDDPRESCLRVTVNDWGYFCDYVVAWWQQQAAFGDDRRSGSIVCATVGTTSTARSTRGCRPVRSGGSTRSCRSAIPRCSRWPRSCPAPG